MSVIIILISCSILVAGGFLVSFFWAYKDGQYEDDYTPSVRILFEEPEATMTETNSNSNSKHPN